MKNTRTASPLLAFVAAVLAATVWGAVVQTQYNLAGLVSVGADISFGVRLRATLQDIFSGFSPTYAAYVVAPSLLAAFLAAAWVAGRRGRSARIAWFSAAGGAAILLGIPLVNYLSPVALLVGASRDPSCTVLMAVGGAVAGALFAWWVPPRAEPREVQRTLETSVAS